ncbi:hypothetical protein [Streptomyces sp. TLI_171]|uniref:hypothetical protein n=1 Tax=Streptomyces sp. TLI_171 TaxID=1938859 RepID=UPI000C17EA6D|nr:hypothetical protein [Streptomyces sp. TLI_171]RKE22221.1 hypothetical protein BX266_5660 [Streptomyces sp. TLI_171]
MPGQQNRKRKAAAAAQRQQYAEWTWQRVLVTLERDELKDVVRRLLADGTVTDETQLRIDAPCSRDGTPPVYVLSVLAPPAEAAAGE